MDLGAPAHVESMHSELLLLILQRDAWGGICLSLVDEELCVELILLAEDLVGLVNDLLHLLARLFHQVEIRGYLGTFYRILGKGMAHLERASTEDGYNRFEAYNDSVTYKAYEE